MTSRMPDESESRKFRPKSTQKTASTVPGAYRPHRKATQKALCHTCNSINNNNKYRSKVSGLKPGVKRKQQLTVSGVVANHGKRDGLSGAPDSRDRMRLTPAGRKKTVPRFFGGRLTSFSTTERGGHFSKVIRFDSVYPVLDVMRYRYTPEDTACP